MKLLYGYITFYSTEDGNVFIAFLNTQLKSIY